VPDLFWFEPQIRATGIVADNGFSCNDAGNTSRRFAFPSVPRPDMVISPAPPNQNKSWLIIETKLRKDTFYRSYVKPGKQLGQFNAIVKYAENGTVTHMGMLLAMLDAKKYPRVAAELQAQALFKNHVILILTSIF
jgi:hypothetical protein